MNASACGKPYLVHRFGSNSCFLHEIFFFLEPSLLKDWTVWTCILSYFQLDILQSWRGKNIIIIDGANILSQSA